MFDAGGIGVDESYQQRTATSSQRKVLAPDDCAGVRFLCSRLAAPVAGQHLSVNGGRWTT